MTGIIFHLSDGTTIAKVNDWVVDPSKEDMETYPHFNLGLDYYEFMDQIDLF